jgi:hypothetical protein
MGNNSAAYYSGLGHQYRKDEKAINACKSSLSQAHDDLKDVDNVEISLLRMDIVRLINKCIHLAYSARQAQKQDI